MTLQFPPTCAKWCSTFRHLKRLQYSPIEIMRLCHKCITHKDAQLKLTRPSKHQLPLMPET